jgi:hypothetical protein
MLHIDQLTYRVRISLECPKFYYEIGHYNNVGEFFQHVVSGYLFDNYGEAERAAVPQMVRIQKALELRLRRQQAAA